MCMGKTNCATCNEQQDQGGRTPFTSGSEMQLLHIPGTVKDHYNDVHPDFYTKSYSIRTSLLCYQGKLKYSFIWFGVCKEFMCQNKQTKSRNSRKSAESLIGASLWPITGQLILDWNYLLKSYSTAGVCCTFSGQKSGLVCRTLPGRPFMTA